MPPSHDDAVHMALVAEQARLNMEVVYLRRRRASMLETFAEAIEAKENRIAEIGQTIERYRQGAGRRARHKARRKARHKA